jgi:hypothetical protein
MRTREFLSSVMSLAWQLVRKNGYTMSEALKCAWTNLKLTRELHKRIVKFYFQKVDGSLREAYGTLKSDLIPETGKSDRAKNDTVQCYYDTEKSSWRCFKRANLIKIA